MKTLKAIVAVIVLAWIITVVVYANRTGSNIDNSILENQSQCSSTSSGSSSGE